MKDKKDRIIILSDVNSFFASVEIALNPELAKVPLAVAGDPQLRHGIILAKNELAKKCGVKTAEPVWKAKEKCPALVCVPPQHDKYKEYYYKCNEIYYRFTNLVEAVSIDESFLDVTASTKLFGDGETIANTLRKTIKDELGITISVGVSFNKTFAKLGSDCAGVDETIVITRETGKKFVFPLPVSSLFLVGRKATETLAKLNIETIGDLAKYNRTILIQHLGQLGSTIHDYANGIDDSPVMPYEYKREEKSVGNGETFEIDVISFDELSPRVLKLAESVGWRLRHKELKATTLQVAIKDSNFSVIQRQKKVSPATNVTFEIAQIAMEIIKENWREGEPIRSVTITASTLVPSNYTCEQMSIFDNNSSHEKAEKLQKTIDEVNKKMGRGSVHFGAE